MQKFLAAMIGLVTFRVQCVPNFCASHGCASIFMSIFVCFFFFFVVFIKFKKRTYPPQIKGLSFDGWVCLGLGFKVREFEPLRTKMKLLSEGYTRGKLG